MVKEFAGIVKNGVIVPDNGVPLTEGARVKISMEILGDSPRTAKQLLIQFAGCMSDLPTDLARNHDHYIHGTPRE